MPADLDSFITRFGGWTEPYFFYNDTIELRFDTKQHIYYLVNGEELEPQDGVTSICHIIDKSEALIPWACKMMAQKLLLTVPAMEQPGSDAIVFLSRPAFEELVTNAKTAHKEKLEEASTVGNLAHNWIEQYIKLELALDEPGKLEHLSRFPADERARNACIAGLDWMARHHVRWVSTERKIYSRTYKYAGTMDGLCYVSSCKDPVCCPHAFTDRLSVADWKSSNYLYMEYMLQTAAYEAAYEEEHGVDIADRWVIRLGKDDGEFEPWHMEPECFAEDFAAFLTALNLARSVAAIKLRIKTKEQNKRATVKVQKAEKKAAAKVEKQIARLAAMEAKRAAATAALALRCKGAGKYKATRKPRCNGGQPCHACLDKWMHKYALQHSRITASPTSPNRARCRLCRDVIESKHRHDFITCAGGHIFIDGGRDYCRAGTLLEGVTFDDIEYIDQPAVDV